jgi:DNA replication protein DnaC
LGKVQILFLDDLGKGRSTPASEEAFFELLNVRLVKCLPTLFTTDLAVERIEAGFSDEYSRGILRRILERVDLIEF